MPPDGDFRYDPHDIYTPRPKPKLAGLDADLVRNLVTPSEAFSAWFKEGPRLAKAAGLHVGIQVTAFHPPISKAKPSQGDGNE